MPIYCDESGGVGRGVMTLAAISIEAEAAVAALRQFCDTTGLTSELKGSRIDLKQRALVFEILKTYDWHATVGIALSVLKPEQGSDPGDHDIAIYAKLLEDVVGSMLPAADGCISVIIDDGRYSPDTLSYIRRDIADMIGPCGMAQLELSHRSAGLQFADVIANSFFNRALVTPRQARFAAILAPFLESGQITLRLLSGDTQRDNYGSE